jgi:hypothetical protein
MRENSSLCLGEFTFMDIIAVWFVKKRISLQ